MNDNGETIAELPTINVTFDPTAQNVNVKFKPEDFRTWDFAIAVLGMAVEAAKFQKAMQQSAAMQSMMQQQAQAEALKRKLSIRPALG